MNNAAIVSIGERRQGLPNIVDASFNWKPPVVEHVFKGAALQVLHNEDQTTLPMEGIVQRGDIRMIEVRLDGNLPLEPLDLHVGGEFRGKNLGRIFAFSEPVLNLKYAPHAPSANNGDNLVVA